MRYSCVKRSGWHVLTTDHTVLPATHTYGMSHPAFTPQTQSITALWLLIIFRPAEGRRLSWPGWLCEILRWFACANTVTHRSTIRGGRESNSRPSSRKSNVITTRLPSHLAIALCWRVKSMPYYCDLTCVAGLFYLVIKRRRKTDEWKYAWKFLWRVRHRYFAERVSCYRRR